MSVRLPGSENIYAYRRGPKRPRGSRQTPEHSLQVAVAQYLTWALPKDVLFTASAAGAKMSMRTATQMKSAGARKGWPDLMLLGTGGGWRGIELKAENGRQTPEQRAFEEHCRRSGKDIYAVCRSVEDVRDALVRWGIKPQCDIDAANRYRGGV